MERVRLQVLPHQLLLKHMLATRQNETARDVLLDVALDEMVLVEMLVEVERLEIETDVVRDENTDGGVDAIEVNVTSVDVTDGARLEVDVSNLNEDDKVEVVKLDDEGWVEVAELDEDDKVEENELDEDRVGDCRLEEDATSDILVKGEDETEGASMEDF